LEVSSTAKDDDTDKPPNIVNKVAQVKQSIIACSSSLTHHCFLAEWWRIVYVSLCLSSAIDIDDCRRTIRRRNIDSNIERKQTDQQH
jgi:hypothetical protein